jgi:hypothetical protein
MAARAKTTTTPAEDTNVTDTNPFDLITFPGRGRATEGAQFDEIVVDAIGRLKKYTAEGVPAERVVTVLDLSGMDAKAVESYRNKLGAALRRIGEPYKMEWRTVPEAKADAFKQFETAMGNEIASATHVLRMVKKDETAAPADETAAPADETVTETEG